MVLVVDYEHPQSPILHEEANTSAKFNDEDLGLGNLYISERTLCWKGHGNHGFSIEYTDISMHAICSDPNVCPNRCVMIIINNYLTLSGFENTEESQLDDSGDGTDTTRLILVPANENAVPIIFDTLNKCQLLNPDPCDEIDEDDDDDEDIYDDAEDNDYAAQNNVTSRGDEEMRNITVQLRNQNIQNEHSHLNGDQNINDIEFEDAD